MESIAKGLVAEGNEATNCYVEYHYSIVLSGKEYGIIVSLNCKYDLKTRIAFNNLSEFL